MNDHDVVAVSSSDRIVTNDPIKAAAILKQDKGAKRVTRAVAQKMAAIFGDQWKQFANGDAIM